MTNVQTTTAADRLRLAATLLDGVTDDDTQVVSVTIYAGLDGIRMQGHPETIAAIAARWGAKVTRDREHEGTRYVSHEGVVEGERVDLVEQHDAPAPVTS